MAMSPPKINNTAFDVLCDNTLAHMLCFLDFKSAMTFSRLTANALRHRMIPSSKEGEVNQAYQHVWRSIFTRHGFVPLDETADKQVDFAEACMERCKLFLNLSGNSKKSRAARRGCFNLPDRHFLFVPVTPPVDDDDSIWDEEMAPPVYFDCSSFVLTNPGVSGEIIFLDPFFGSLVIRGCCTENAVCPNELIMEQAVMDASELSQKANELGLDRGDDEDIVGEGVIDEIYQSDHIEQYTKPPTQFLIDVEDYHQIDLSDYFVLANKNQRREGEHELILGEDDEVDIDYIGIECKSVLGNSHEIEGTMVSVGRSLVSDNEGWGDSQVCTEMICWKRIGTTGCFDERFVCRLRSSYHCLEICPQFNRLYVVFPFGEGPFRRFDVEIQDEETDSMDFEGGGRVVVCYPLLDYPVDNNEDVIVGPRYFPQPLFSMRCCHSVSTIVIDPSGVTILVGTKGGTIESWTTQAEPGAALLNIMYVHQLVDNAMKSRDSSLRMMEAASPMSNVRVDSHLLGTEGPPQESSEPPIAPDSSEFFVSPRNFVNENAVEYIHVVEDDDDDNTIPVMTIATGITSFHYPSHLSLNKTGFVTLQHKHGESSTLLLWKSFPQGNFGICSRVKLPLCSRRKPCINYDGRRLVVFGQDHIGMVILVYHVLTTWEDLDMFETKNDGSAGVENFTIPGRIRFVNRIRHIGLGGFEYFESTYMTCNERFLVVNTKTGNLLGGGRSHTTDGLLVIDLEDHL